MKIIPSRPQNTAYWMLVRPPRFSGVSLYSQETVPKAISWNREQKYSKAAPMTALTTKNQQTVGVAQLIQAEGQHDAAEARTPG